MPLDPVLEAGNKKQAKAEDQNRSLTTFIAYRIAAGLGLRTPLLFVDVKHS